MCATFVFTPLNIRLGRRITLIVAAAICVISNALSCIPIHWIYLATIRIFAGLGSSILLTTMPMLFSEFINPELRGVFSSLMNYFICMGSFLSNILQLFLVLNDKLFYLAFFPSMICALIVFCLCFFVKEKGAASSNILQKDEKSEKML